MDRSEEGDGARGGLAEVSEGTVEVEEIGGLRWGGPELTASWWASVCACVGARDGLYSDAMLTGPDWMNWNGVPM